MAIFNISLGMHWQTLLYCKLYASVDIFTQPWSFTGEGTPMPVKKAIRQLPPLPEQQKSSVRRHSSYTGSTVYDTVKEVHSHFPPEDSKTPQQQTAEGSTFLEKVDENDGKVFPIYAQVNKKVPLGHSIRPSSLYANVNKTDSQEVKSELFCNV